MATIMGEIRDQEETALSFKPGGSHIQIDSISIEISSGEINGLAEECKHFSIRGFVWEQRKKDRRLCSPFISDGDTISSSSSSSMELDLPPLDVHKFKWWRCSGCLQGCNSLQGEGTNCKQEIAMCLRQQKGSLSKSKAGQIRSVAKGKQLVVEEEEEEEEETLKNIANQGKVRLLIHDDDYSQVCRPSKSSRKSGSNMLCSSSSKVVMGPPPPSLPPLPGGFANARTTCSSTPPSKSLSKQHSKSAASSSPPSCNLPAGRAIFSNPNHSSQTRPQPLLGPLSSKKQNVHIPEPNGWIWHKAGQTSTPAASSHKKRNYAKRSVPQKPDTAAGGHIHKRAGGNGFPSNSNTEILQHDVAKEADVLMPERFNDDQVPLQLDRNEEVGSSNKFIEKVSNYSTAGRDPDQGQILLKHNQFAEDGVEGHFHPDKDGTNRNFNSARPLVESNRLLKKPRIDFELESAGRSNTYIHLRRAPKIRLLSDVIAKSPTNFEEQQDNSNAYPSISTKSSEQSTKRKASPVASHDTTTAERNVSDKAGEQSTKSKASPVVSPAGRGVSFSSGSWKKKERSLQDTEHHSFRFVDPHDRTMCITSRYRPDIADSKRQGKHAFDRAEVDKKSKKTRVQNAVPSSVPSRPRHVSTNNCEMPLPSGCCSLGEAASSRPVGGGQVTDGGINKSNKNIFYPDKEERVQVFDKKINFPQIGKDNQPATKFLQFGPENAPGEGTSDCTIIGSGFKRSDAVENYENSSIPSSTMTDYPKILVSTGNELRIPRVQAGSTLVERKSGEKGVKGRVIDIDINSIPVEDKTPEPGDADDSIPMDIGELLAKHQLHGRRCDAKREKLISILEEVNGGENSSAGQKSYPSLLKPQASYSYSYTSNGNNGMVRGAFEAVMSCATNQNVSDGSLCDQSRKGVLVGCLNDDTLGGPYSSGYNNAQISQVHRQCTYSSSSSYNIMCNAAAKSWNGNMGAFRPTSRVLQPAVQSLFNRPQPPPTPALNTQIWMPRSSSISFNIGNHSTNSSSPTHPQSRTCSEYASAAAAPPSKSNETIPAMQLLSLVQVAGSSTSKSKLLPFDDNHHHYHQYYNNSNNNNNNNKKLPLNALAGQHFEPYNKPTTTTTCPMSAAASAFQNDPAAAATSYTDPSLLRDHFSSEKKRKPASAPPIIAAAAKASQGAQMYAVQQQQLVNNPVSDHVTVHNKAPAEICMTNRNPAEILDLKEVTRSYMIGPQDLRRAKPRRIPPTLH